MKKEIVFSDFSNTDRWKVINDFTIHEDRNLKDRPYMLTRVPKKLQVSLDNIYLSEQVRFNGDIPTKNLIVNTQGEFIFVGESEERPSGYNLLRHISAKGSFDDKITVFSVPGGAQMQFSELKNVRIAPLPKGIIGGKFKANFYDGIRFSGFGSQDIPASGMMAGEPGSIFVYEPDSDFDGGGAPYLAADLYIDEEVFENFFNFLIQNFGFLERLDVTITADFFQTEVEAALSEPRHKQEYGMLSKGERIGPETRARLDSFQAIYFRKSSPTSVAVEEFGSNTVSPEKAVPIVAAESVSTAQLNEFLKSIRSRSGWVLGILAAILITLLFT